MSESSAQKNVVIVSLNATMFGGYKINTDSDIVAAGGRVPDTDIMTRGGKHIFPRDKLQPFSKILKAVNRELWGISVKSFGKGRAIVDEDIEKAEQILEKGKADFYQALTQLCLHYNKWLEDHIRSQKPAVAAIVRKSSLTMEEACTRFSFSYELYRPIPVGKNSSVESMHATLIYQLYEEVAFDAFNAWDKTFMPIGAENKRYQRKVGQRAKGVFLGSPDKPGCRDKLAKWSILNPNLLGAVDIIDRVLATTPDKGSIEDKPGNPAATRLLGLVNLMKDAKKFAAAAEQMVSTSTPDEDIEVLCGITTLWSPNKQVAKVIEEIAVESQVAKVESVVQKSVPMLTALLEQHSSSDAFMMF